MRFQAIAQLTTRTGTSSYCTSSTVGELAIPASFHIRTLTIVIVAAINYDQTRGNAANNFSFKGADSGPYVEAITSSAADKSKSDFWAAHTKDYQHLADAFSLYPPDTAGTPVIETSVIISWYVYTGSGDPHLESLLFVYARHLFISASRDTSLPPNIQGRWTSQTQSTWGADYHANINFQMNLWGPIRQALATCSYLPGTICETLESY